MSTLTDLTPATPADDQPVPATDHDTVQPGDQPPGGTEPDPGGVTARPVIAVALLSAHHGNIRRDLDLSAEFLASIQANGVLVPLRITTGDDGGYRVIDGHRRLAAAMRAGLTEVPADLAGERAGDEPGQYLDMWTAHRHRKALAPLEEADALFAAREAGATRARIRKATGLKPGDVTAALTAAKLSPDTRATVDALDHQLTLDQLSVLTEFDNDPQAIARLTTAAWTGAFEHEAERLRQQRAEHAEHERLRRELGQAGVTVTPTLPPGAHPLAGLRHDGADLTPESHAACSGRGAYFRSYDPTTPVHYCADPAGHGHTFRYADTRASASAAGAVGTLSPADPDGSPGQSDPGLPDPGPADAARRLVISGNKAWRAASEVRKRWLVSLFARRTAPREVAPFVARQLLTMPDPMRSGLAAAPGRVLFSEITGQPAASWLEACDTVAAGRVPLLLLGPVATAFEQAMTEGEGKNTWRLDRYSPCPRDQAGRYLAFLGTLGYQLSGIEQAVAQGEPWTGDTASGGQLPADGDPAGSGAGPGSADDPVAGAEDVTQDADTAVPDSQPCDTGGTAEAAA
jgi:ParB family chromosome partitioning protein